MPILEAPKVFQGSWIQLYRDHIQAVLPQVDDVCQFHEWLAQYCNEFAPIFPVRAVTGAERRQVYSTVDGTQIAPADNSPAWVVHALLMERRLSSYREFRDMMLTMPTHMFDIRKYVRQTANDCGWYVAHIVPAKNRDTNFRLWTRPEVERRFYLTLHPCNLFFIPGVRNRSFGEDPRVIRFIADQYAERYGAIWGDFLKRVNSSLDFGHQDLGSTLVAFDSDIAVPKRAASNSRSQEIVRGEPATALTTDGHPRPSQTPDSAQPGSDSTTPVSSRGAAVKVSYRAYRLTFKRDYIEPLGADELFEVVTPWGSTVLQSGPFIRSFQKSPTPLHIVNSASITARSFI